MERTAGSDFYMARLADHAESIGKDFPTRDYECCVEFATSLATACKSKFCSTRLLTGVLERALCKCRTSP
jgi:hypothetical protein